MTPAWPLVPPASSVGKKRGARTRPKPALAPLEPAGGSAGFAMGDGPPGGASRERRPRATGGGLRVRAQSRLGLALGSSAAGARDGSRESRPRWRGSPPSPWRGRRLGLRSSRRHRRPTRRVTGGIRAVFEGVAPASAVQPRPAHPPLDCGAHASHAAILRSRGATGKAGAGRCCRFLCISLKPLHKGSRAFPQSSPQAHEPCAARAHSHKRLPRSVGYR